ncbi:MAG TPA: membrane protein insertase YidC, partial [Pseudobdellovibrionaceae bacterium]|nr:membrane protein insertase YidC [Pseudobdellovibrionaceae bacterium]
RTFTYNKDDSSLRSQVRVSGWSDELREGLSVTIPEVIHSPASSSWLFPSYDHQDFFVEFGGTKNTVNFNHAKENISRDFPTASLVSVGNQYFTLALLDQSSLAPSVHLSTNLSERSALANVIYKPARAEDIRFEQVFYAGPKSIDVLKKVDPAMAEIIDFGYLSFIAKPLLYIMKWFHSLVGNWGVAIILLTMLVRFVVLPFNLMSARSMRAMQRIQPLMKDLREKHKDDPMTMNRETMNLMKEHKANPVGGCLPVLLQIPIFFALFRVIGSTVELYQSPFAWWIQDLSAHDAYFVLPVILGFTMFLQQRMTPTTMDPAQAKIMAFLPLVFTVFMLYLPSGLTLYMVVSALFGITQQWYILRDAPAPVPAITKNVKK